MKQLVSFLGLLIFFIGNTTTACSIIYYVDAKTGAIYVVNNEDYFYDVKAYVQIEPAKNGQLARAWYGWDNFAQGGINEAGLSFDGAVIPSQGLLFERPKKFRNLGDYILASFKTVDEVITFIKKENIQLDGAQMLLGDATANAVILSWESGIMSTTFLEGNSLVATNFNAAKPDLGNYPCYRYDDINKRIAALNDKESPASFLEVGNLIGGAAQIPRKDAEGRTGGTLYTSFLDITNKQMIIVYQLDNKKITKLDLNEEFTKNKRRKIKLK